MVRMERSLIRSTMKITHVPATKPSAQSVVRRAVRHPAAGLGWLWLQPAEVELLEAEDRPPAQHPDPNVSGQNPAFTKWAIEQTKAFAYQPAYRSQIDQRLEQIDTKIKSTLQDLQGLAAQIDQLQDERHQVAQLIPDYCQPDPSLPVDGI